MAKKPIKPKPTKPSNILSSTSNGNTGKRTSVVHGKPRTPKK